MRNKGTPCDHCPTCKVCLCGCETCGSTYCFCPSCLCAIGIRLGVSGPTAHADVMEMHDKNCIVEKQPTMKEMVDDLCGRIENLGRRLELKITELDEGYKRTLERVEMLKSHQTPTPSRRKKR